ncbi:MAG TPA: J domain-containing protein [Armatimonadetes bacterium]|nr:J domain-containing protein [Armatimonadota bacterium]
MEARAEMEAWAQAGGAPPPMATPQELRLPEAPSVEERSPKGPPTLDLGPQAKSPPPGLAALASHYATLDLPPTANLEQVGRAYRRLKARCNPEQFSDDPVQQARARQEEARLDEAYLTLRKALARERRL